MLWSAQLVSNLGTWMQTVGAQWILVDKPHAAVLVSLVQTATSMPVMLLSVPSGVVADLLDRRRLLVVTQSTMAALAAILAVSTFLGHTTPVILLLVLFLLGCGQAMTAPAWQSVQPELVPREQIPAAAALGSMNMNIGRAVGPALAGILVAAAGPTTVFALNAVSFFGIVGALLTWRPATVHQARGAERPLAALQAGVRFIRAAPSIRRVLLRSILFVGPASAVWALLPVIARGRLGAGSAGYGVLLGALGVGAVLGALSLSRVRGWFTATQRLTIAAVLFAVASVGAAVLHSMPVVTVLLVGAGVAWLLANSTLNATMQLLLPSWVRARGLSVYMLTFMGGQALGSLVWGLVAGHLGAETALLIAAGLLVATALSTRWLPVRNDPEIVDLTPEAFWPEPRVLAPPDPTAGPILIHRVYHVPEPDVAEFLTAMVRVGRSRQRTGAVQWRVYRDLTRRDRYVEAFRVRSWEEHMQQHKIRLTAQDRRAEAAVAEFSEPNQTVHYLAVLPDR